MENKCLDIEVSILRNDTFDHTITEGENIEIAFQLTEEVLKLLLRGQYEQVLEAELTHRLLHYNNSKKPACNTAEELIQHNAVEYLQEATENDRIIREIGILCVGVSCLQLFAQNNWVGPVTETNSTHFEETLFKVAHVREYLSVDCEQIYSLTHHPIYLLIARTLLLDCHEHLTHCKTADWWLLRCIQTHQALLDERSPSLKATAEDLVDKILTKEPLMTDDKYKDLALQFHTEAGHLMYFYYEPAKAREHFAQAKKLADLKINLTGALGKRTRFQQSDLPQLIVKVERVSVQEEKVQQVTPEASSDALVKAETMASSATLPKNIALDDDTVMNQIQFRDPEDSPPVKLRPVEQALVLGLCYENRKTQEGHTEIIAEESLAYINCILGQPQDWCVESTALLMRTRWERDSTRRLERSMTQLEELVQQFSRPQPPGGSRTRLIYSVQLPPHWVIQRELGELFVKIGSTKAALEVFERLQLWEEVIKCYHHLGRKDHAEKLIREQLAITETPSLWCYLGDVLHDEDCYQKAWELSNCRYARAQRALGYLYLTRGKFEKVLPCFEKSLAINALQIGVWFSYGCAALACDKYETAAKAFHRCVTIHSDNFEAWSNLATAYIRSKQKHRAFLTLQEAIKCDYENWKIWENYLLVSTDIGQFDDGIKAYHRLLDLKEKYADTEVLAILVRAINENMDTAAGEPASSLRPQLLQLFGRLTSKVTSDADVWRLYAELLTGGSTEVSQTDRERALQYLQKSHRCATQAVNWQRNVQTCQKVAAQSALLAKAYLQCGSKVEDAVLAGQLLSSGRLMLKGVASKIKQQHTDPVSQVLLPELQESCDSLETKLQELADAITQLRT